MSGSARKVRVPLSLVRAAFAYDRCVKTDERAVDTVSLGSRSAVMFSPVMALLSGWPVSGLVLWEADAEGGSDIGIGPTVARALRRVWLAFIGAVVAYIAIVLTTGYLLAGLGPFVAFVVYRRYLLRRYWIKVKKAGEALEIGGASAGFRAHVESLLTRRQPAG